MTETSRKGVPLKKMHPMQNGYLASASGICHCRAGEHLGGSGSWSATAFIAYQGSHHRPFWIMHLFFPGAA